MSWTHVFSILIAPIAASFFVLAVAGVGRGIWFMQALAVCSACVLAAVIARYVPTPKRESVMLTVSALTLLGLGAPLWGSSAQPERWLHLGPFNLYVAPVLVPSLLAVCSVCVLDRGRYEVMALAVPVAAGGLLALQPDASQALALCVGGVVVLAHRRQGFVRSGLVLAGLILATAWAFVRPDPLEPVPHVEGVFALAFSHSLLGGVAVCGGALSLLVGLWWRSRRTMPWLLAVAAYYAVLYICSVAGLTPAPLIGYGTGPILGFGLLVAVSCTLGSSEPNKDVNV